jgi:general secretion pathway protein I
MRNKIFHARGFTLIEALVALVLIGAFGMALFTWIDSSMVSLRRVEDATARNDATANIIEYMQAVNPMQTPQGKADFGSYQIQWNADPVTDQVDGLTSPQGTSLYQLVLYQTKISVTKAGDPYWFDLKLKLVGYKKVRSPTNLFQG